MATATRRVCSGQHLRGFTYLGVLFIVSLLAITSAAASVVWATAQQRDNEVELVFVGRQIASAIDRYRAHSVALGANVAQVYPRRLEDLLRDNRATPPLRHLRRIFLDPLTGNAEWGLIRLPDGGIVGVHSLSSRAPYPRTIVVAGYAAPVASSYQGWRFIAPTAEVLLTPSNPPPLSAAQPRDTAASPTAPVERLTTEPPGAAGSPPGAGPGDASAAKPESVPRPTLEDLRTRTPEACSRIAAHDEQVCATQAERFGDDAARECRDSATARSVACAVGDQTPLAPLIIRYR